MPAQRYVALLRGINVGGNNIIKMAELRATLEGMGFTDVRTYIQSGNVVFGTDQRSSKQLIRTIEQSLSSRFGYVSQLVLISAADLERVVAAAPPGFGTQPGRYRYDVLFVKPPTTPAQVLAQLTPRSGVDTATAGRHAVYFRRLSARAAHSNLSRLAALPVYKSVTARNWNTTTKLLALVAE